MWYFVRENRTEYGVIKEKYSLIIDGTCFIHSVSFTNGSCVKFLSIDDNKRVLYDGYHGPAIRIYGKILSNKSIRVSDMIILQ